MTVPSLGALPIDLARLMETRALLVANSGAGKSHALRRILEQTAGGVQQLVIDPEGEFATLRERFDYIVCAPSGADAVATPQTAAALARALWGAGVSAVLDIYELKAHERILFVRRFLDSLISAPRSMWHPTIVAIDEVHVFAPQVGSAESGGAVADLATRGRKRGLALVGATQRLSKLHKDVAAELLNKLIGRTGLDVDVQRAADELGMSRAAATEALRNLEPGEFFAFGPALSRAVVRTKIGPVATTHPQTGQRALTAPPPASQKVLAQLAKIEGLQREAEAEQRSAEELRAEVAALKRKLTLAEKAQAGQGVPEAEVQRRISVAVNNAAALLEPVGASRALLAGVEKIAAGLQAVQAELAGVSAELVPRAATVARAPRQREASAAPAQVAAGITLPQQKILDALARLEAFGVAAPQKPTVAAMAGVSSKSSGYANNLGAMRSRGLIDYPAGGCVALSEAGRVAANAPSKPPTLQDLHDGWLAMVTRPQAELLRVLISSYPVGLPKLSLAARAGVSVQSSGFANNLGALRSLGAIDYPQPGHVVATALLFPKGIA